jgi:ribosome modulation factor
MSKQKAISLQQLRSDLRTEQAKRDALVDQGRRAYHLGIEERDCPLNEPSQRKLWSDGWRIARDKFSAMLKRWAAAA